MSTTESEVIESAPDTTTPEVQEDFLGIGKGLKKLFGSKKSKDYEPLIEEEDDVVAPSSGSEDPAAKLAEAITAKDWGAAWTWIVKVGSSAAKLAWVSYDTATRETFAKTLTYTQTKGSQAIVKALFDATPDEELNAMKALFGARFNVKVGTTLHPSKTGEEFDLKGLRRCWSVLEPLPPKHVEGNEWLEAWTRYQGGGSGGGYYWAHKKESSMGYDSGKIDNKNNAADPGDPLYQVIRFNKVVRHEIGHAVDKKIDGFQYAKTSDGGGWKKHGTANKTLVTTMVTAAGGAISTWGDNTQKGKMIDAITTAVTARKPEDAKTDVGDLDFWSGEGAPASEDKVKALKDPIFAMLDKNGKSDKSPWYNGGGIALGDRVYQESYPNDWTSYESKAWDKKVSTYQFRAPGEWFAESYATYYEPDGEGEVGTLLQARDSKTKTWFDANVHTA